MSRKYIDTGFPDMPISANITSSTPIATVIPILTYIGRKNRDLNTKTLNPSPTPASIKFLVLKSPPRTIPDSSILGGIYAFN